jgi:hypothetical protein
MIGSMLHSSDTRYKLPILHARAQTPLVHYLAGPVSPGPEHLVVKSPGT